MGSFLKSLVLASILSFVYYLISTRLALEAREGSSTSGVTDLVRLLEASPLFLLLLNFFVIANFLNVYEAIESLVVGKYERYANSSESSDAKKKGASPGFYFNRNHAHKLTTDGSGENGSSSSSPSPFRRQKFRRSNSGRVPDSSTALISATTTPLDSNEQVPLRKSSSQQLMPVVNHEGDTNITNSVSKDDSNKPSNNEVASLQSSGTTVPLSSNAKVRKFKSDKASRQSVAPSSPLSLATYPLPSLSRLQHNNGSASVSPSSSPLSSPSSSDNGSVFSNDGDDEFYFDSEENSDDEGEDEGGSGASTPRSLQSSGASSKRFSLYSSNPPSSLSFLLGKKGQSHHRATISASSPALLPPKSSVDTDLSAESNALSNLSNSCSQHASGADSSIPSSAENSPRKPRKGSLVIQDKVKWYDDLVRERKLRQELLDSIQSNNPPVNNPLSLSEDQPATSSSSRHLRITSSSPFISEVVAPHGTKKASSEVSAKTDEETDQLLLEQELRALMKERKVKLNLKEFNSRRAPMTEGISWRSISVNIKEADICGHTSTPFGNTLILLGGKHDREEKSRIEVNFFDTESNTWSKLSRCTGLKIGNMWNHQTVRVGDRLYSFGGYVEGKLSNDVFVMSLRDDGSAHWSKLRQTTNIPSAREGHTLSRYGKMFFLFGGHNGQDVLSDMNVLNTETGVWTKITIKEGEEPPPRRGHAAVVLDNKLIIFGGLGRKEENYNDVWVFHLDELSWEQCKTEGSSPPGVYEHAMARIGKKAIVFGGKRMDHCTNSLFLMSISESSSKLRITWSTIAGTCPTPRRLHSINCVSGNLYVIGGIAQNDDLCDDIWIGDIVNMPFVATNIDYSSLKIKEKIAEGNFAIVHRAIWNGTEVAVKKFKRKKDHKEDNKALKDFKTEVELLSLVCHPNVMAILGYCHEKQRCIVMEYLPNNLYDFIHEQTNPIAPDLMLQLASDIVRGVKYLHSQRIIHRDLKSSNLLLDRHLNVKIGDLGISRVVSLTNTMTTIGTIAWTAPEILRHEPYDERADIYSFSIVLWELCTRRVPYEDEQKNPMEIGVMVANKNISRPKIDPTVVSIEYATLIEKCWSESPSHRPSFEEIEQYLKNTF